ncbi:MAG TPA: CBS domain-containing protein [Actinomycetospora sp.]|uniref:CBS domain-containing protein n=1 Tax=Actinomycetospora sp. TaxID=1872135 RepID=UPI002F42DEF0
MVLRAGRVMTQGVVTVTPDSPLEEARSLLTANRFSALPVVDREYRLVGIISTLDVLRAEVDGRADARVGQVMTRDPMTATRDTAVSILAHRLRHYGERRVMPIVQRGILVGVVTRGDLLRPPERRSFFDRLLGAEPVDLDTPMADQPRVGTTAGEVMTPRADLVVATTDTPVDVAAAALSANRLTALPVLGRDDRLLGIVSEADLVTDDLSGRRSPLPAVVGDAMTTPVTAVRHDVPLVKVARKMIEYRRRVFPVLGDDGRVIGMVSRGDLLRADSPPPPTAQLA